MSEAAYLLCAITALVCSILLLRRGSSSLLFWGGICFLALAIENALVFVDLVILPDVDLAPWRALIGAVGLGAFVWGLVWQAFQERSP